MTEIINNIVSEFDCEIQRQIDRSMTEEELQEKIFRDNNPPVIEQTDVLKEINFLRQKLLELESKLSQQ